jgi:hypothetical protein
VGFDAIASQFQGADGALTATYSLPDNATILSYSGSSPVVQLTGVRALYDAAVTGEYDSRVSPTRLTRTVNGDLYTAVLPGRYVLTTPSPLSIFPGRGPCAGELLLTADNATSVRIVAVDPGDNVSVCSARLDLDLDGNGSIDRSIEVPWQDL